MEFKVKLIYLSESKKAKPPHRQNGGLYSLVEERLPPSPGLGFICVSCFHGKCIGMGERMEEEQW